MSVDWMYFKWWIDQEDGAPWVEHECVDGVDSWRLPPPWKLDEEGGITPSFDCKRCGKHTILFACDRVAR